MQNNKKTSFSSLQWSNKNSKSFCYEFHLGQVVGLNVASEYESYLNWKKLLYAQINPSLTLKTHFNGADTSFENFTNQIKLITPRPIDKSIENFPIEEIYAHIQLLNQVQKNIDHSLLQISMKASWKILPLFKKVLLQILNSIDENKKINFIFLERLQFAEKEAQVFAEILKNISSKYNLSIIIFTQSKLIPSLKWLPLFTAPTERISSESYDEEDSDEAAS